MFIVPLLAAIVGAVFAAAVLNQFRSRHRPYQAAWGAALAMFAAGAAFETFGIAAGWNAASYKGYYLFGAILNVGWLGVGTIYLLAPRRAGDVAALVMGLISLAALAGVAVSPTNAALLQAQVPGRGAIGQPAPIFPLLTNLPGSVILIGGAAWSAWQALRRNAPAGRVLGTALIAAGAFVVAGGHSYAQVRGLYVIQPAAEAIGIALMFAGYLAVEVMGRLGVRPRAALR
jgi:hypothetical protein